MLCRVDGVFAPDAAKEILQTSFPSNLMPFSSPACFVTAHSLATCYCCMGEVKDKNRVAATAKGLMLFHTPEPS